MEQSPTSLQDQVDKLKEDLNKEQGSILDEKLPHRFGNRRTRRKLQSQIRKIKS